MSLLPATLSIQNGIAHLNGAPRLLVTADYPYYRDERANWADRLAKLKALGLAVITAYIPWRHHQLTPDSAPDLTGQTQPNRDVLGFIELCRRLDLALVLKPGPFIHAETNYGSLPDWVCPDRNPAIEPLLDASGQRVWWMGAELDASGQRVKGWPLPAPFGPEFLRLTQQWLTQVGDAVIQPHQTPSGPVVAVQVGNEGIYSNGQHAPWAYDYSASGLKLYRLYLQECYGDVANYNQQHATTYAEWGAVPPPTHWHHPERPEHFRAYLDWGEFQAEYMGRIFMAWAAPLKVTVPVVVNQNPPLDEPYGLDAWLTRVEPERWPGLHYGFTNWVGDISANPSAFDRYLLTAKRYPGLNWEENWGFAELYDPAYVDAATCFYQTLVILNGGATGFNIYTGVATAHAGHNLEVLPKIPYPDAAPITEHGELTPKAEIARWLVKFMDCYGAEFLACRPAQPVAWGLYLPHARAGAWVPAADHNPAWPALGRHLKQFQSQLRAEHLDYGIINLHTASVDECLRYPRLVVSGGPFMASATQAKLAAYVQRGGQLAVVGALPTLDEAFEPCAQLQAMRDSVRVLPDGNVADWLADAERPRVLAGEADVWVRSHPERDVHFVTALIPARGQTHVRVEFCAGARRHVLEMEAAPSGGLLLRIAAGRASAVIIKGHNGFLGHSLAPRCVLDGESLGHAAPGDFAWIEGEMAYLPAV